MANKYISLKYGKQSFNDAQQVVEKLNELIVEYENYYQQLVEAYNQGDYPAHYFQEELRFKSPVFFFDGPLGCGKTYFMQTLLKAIHDQPGMIRNDNIIYIDCINFASSKSNYESILWNIFHQVYKLNKQRWYWAFLEWAKNFLGFTRFSKVRLIHRVDEKTDPNILYYQSNYIPTNWSKFIQSQVNAVSISKNSNMAFVKVNLSSGKSHSLKAKHGSSYATTKTLIDINELTYKYDEVLKRKTRTLVVLENVERLAIHTWEIPRILQLLSSFDNFVVLVAGDIDTMNKLYCNINVNHMEKFSHFMPFKIDCPLIGIYLDVINNYQALDVTTNTTLFKSLNKSYETINKAYPQKLAHLNNAREFKKAIKEEVKECFKNKDISHLKVNELLQPWNKFMQANGMNKKTSKGSHLSK